MGVVSCPSRACNCAVVLYKCWEINYQANRWSLRWRPAVRVPGSPLFINPVASWAGCKIRSSDEKVTEVTDGAIVHRKPGGQLTRQQASFFRSWCRGFLSLTSLRAGPAVI